MKKETEEIEESPTRYTSLPDVFIDRVKNFMAVIAEVDSTPLHDFLEAFQKDQHPETELEVWEKIAATYQWAVVGSPGLTQDQKKDVFTVVLGLSMGTMSVDNVRSLSDELVTGIITHFSQ